MLRSPRKRLRVRFSDVNNIVEFEKEEDNDGAECLSGIGYGYHDAWKGIPRLPSVAGASESDGATCPTTDGEQSSQGLDGVSLPEGESSDSDGYNDTTVDDLSPTRKIEFWKTPPSTSKHSDSDGQDCAPVGVPGNNMEDDGEEHPALRRNSCQPRYSHMIPQDDSDLLITEDEDDLAQLQSYAMQSPSVSGGNSLEKSPTVPSSIVTDSECEGMDTAKTLGPLGEMTPQWQAEGRHALADIASVSPMNVPSSTQSGGTRGLDNSEQTSSHCAPYASSGGAYGGLRRESQVSLGIVRKQAGTYGGLEHAAVGVAIPNENPPTTMLLIDDEPLQPDTWQGANMTESTGRSNMPGIDDLSSTQQLLQGTDAPPPVEPAMCTFKGSCGENEHGEVQAAVGLCSSIENPFVPSQILANTPPAAMQRQLVTTSTSDQLDDEQDIKGMLSSASATGSSPPAASTDQAHSDANVLQPASLATQAVASPADCENGSKASLQVVDARCNPPTFDPVLMRTKRRHSSLSPTAKRHLSAQHLHCKILRSPYPVPPTAGTPLVPIQEESGTEENAEQANFGARHDPGLLAHGRPLNQLGGEGAKVTPLNTNQSSIKICSVSEGSPHTSGSVKEIAVADSSPRTPQMTLAESNARATLQQDCVNGQIKLDDSIKASTSPAPAGHAVAMLDGACAQSSSPGSPFGYAGINPVKGSGLSGKGSPSDCAAAQEDSIRPPKKHISLDDRGKSASGGTPVAAQRTSSVQMQEELGREQYASNTTSSPKDHSVQRGRAAAVCRELQCKLMDVSLVAHSGTVDFIFQLCGGAVVSMSFTNAGLSVSKARTVHICLRPVPVADDVDEAFAFLMTHCMQLQPQSATGMLGADIQRKADPEAHSCRRVLQSCQFATNFLWDVAEDIIGAMLNIPRVTDVGWDAHGRIAVEFVDLRKVLKVQLTISIQRDEIWAAQNKPPFLLQRVHCVCGNKHEEDRILVALENAAAKQAGGPNFVSGMCKALGHVLDNLPAYCVEAATQEHALDFGGDRQAAEGTIAAHPMVASARSPRTTTAAEHILQRCSAPFSSTLSDPFTPREHQAQPYGSGLGDAPSASPQEMVYINELFDACRRSSLGVSKVTC